MWSSYEYQFVILLLLTVLIAILLSVHLLKKQVKIIHSLSNYKKKEKLDSNIIAKVEYINSKLQPLGLVYNIKFDIIYSIDDGKTIDKLIKIKEDAPELFDEIKNFDAVKRFIN